MQLDHNPDVNVKLTPPPSSDSQEPVPTHHESLQPVELPLSPSSTASPKDKVAMVQQEDEKHFDNRLVTMGLCAVWFLRR